jgi:hypothetical protein
MVGKASTLSDRILFEAATMYARLDKLEDEADAALDFEACQRVGVAAVAMADLIAETPAQTLARAMLKLRRLGTWQDSHGIRDLDLLKDAVAVIEREIARKGSAL